MERPCLPPGIYFNPTAVDLLDYYLPRWLHGEPLNDVRGFIVEDDVYGCDPETLTGRYPPVNNAGHWFFFSQCKRQSRSGTKMERTAGDGCWISQQAKKPVIRHREKIGHRQSFRYGHSERRMSQWLMEEYHCDLEEATDADGTYRMYKIYFSPRDSQRWEPVHLLPPQMVPAALTQESCFEYRHEEEEESTASQRLF